MRLPDVYAARFVMAEDGSGPEAIDVLAGMARGAKQIVRDIQSSLSAVYSLQIDYKIISVAQVPFDPFHDQATPMQDACHDRRVEYSGLCYRESGSRCTVQVTLTDRGMAWEGEASGRTGPHCTDRLAAAATLRAVNAIAGQENLYSLVGLQRLKTPAADLSVALVQMDGADGILSGTAVMEEGSMHGVVRSTLDAINRSLAMKLHDPEN